MMSLSIKTTLNDQVVQDWDTGDMIFDIPALIEFLSASTTLPPGTVILTGTPHGVGQARKPPLWLKPGDTVTVEIEKIVCPIIPAITDAGRSAIFSDISGSSGKLSRDIPAMRVRERPQVMLAH